MSYYIVKYYDKAGLVGFKTFRDYDRAWKCFDKLEAKGYDVKMETY